mgnify:CR=1 FL=1
MKRIYKKPLFLSHRLNMPTILAGSNESNTTITGYDVSLDEDNPYLINTNPTSIITDIDPD